MNGFALNNISDAKFGSTQVQQIYYGSTLVWPTTPPTPANDYFYIETYNNNTTIYFGNKFSGGMDARNNLEYSLNKTTWYTLQYGSANAKTKTTPGKIYFRCTNPQISSYNNGMGMFCVDKDYKIGGNIMSLIFGDNYLNQTSLVGYAYIFGWLFYDETHLLAADELMLPATTLSGGCYENMFDGCTSLTTAPALPATTLNSDCYFSMFRDCTSLTTAPALPATTLAVNCYRGMFYNCTSLTTAPALPVTTLADSCYQGMFSGCSSLTTAPALPATTLADYCYQSMFANCTSLTTAPALPATTLADRCYYKMFYGCTSLTTAPTLPATTLVIYCYYAMFSGCSNLNYVKCLATNISAYDCLVYWLSGVASSGTFVKASGSSWPTGSNGIPANWTIQNV